MTFSPWVPRQTSVSEATSPQRTPLVEVRGLTVFRGDDALINQLDFSLYAGEMVRIAGSNGSGKTTLMRLLCGLALADEGEILWQGKRWRPQRSAIYAQTLYLGHKPGIKAELSAVENLRLSQRLSGLRDDAAINTALATVALGDRADLPCAVLSAGQQRRVALARLLLQPSTLWMLDEPLTALDAEGRNIVTNLIRQHVETGGALLYTTHHELDLPGIPSRSLMMAGQA